MLGLAPFREAQSRRLECAGLNGIAAHLEERSVHALDDVGGIEDEAVHPALERRAAVLFECGVLGMQAGAHGAVDHEHAALQCLEKWRLHLDCHG